jgi:hypothetical protein
MLGLILASAAAASVCDVELLKGTDERLAIRHEDLLRHDVLAIGLFASHLLETLLDEMRTVGNRRTILPPVHTHIL